jgi:hypothetical protein
VLLGDPFTYSINIAPTASPTLAAFILVINEASPVAGAEANTEADADADAEAEPEADTAAAGTIAAGFSSSEHPARAIVALSQISPAIMSIFAFSQESGQSSRTLGSMELCVAHQEDADLVKEWKSARSELGTAVETLSKVI